VDIYLLFLYEKYRRENNENQNEHISTYVQNFNQLRLLDTEFLDQFILQTVNLPRIYNFYTFIDKYVYVIAIFGYNFDCRQSRRFYG